MYNFGFRLLVLIGLCCITLSSCNKKLQVASLRSAIDDPRLLEVHTLSDDYLIALSEWRESRYKSITSPEGWLSVMGLHWLKEGENRIGSGLTNDVVLPEFMGDYIASIYMDNGALKFRAYGESFLGDGDQPDADGNIYHDGAEKPTVLKAKSLVMNVLKRGDRYALRIKNTLSDARFAMKDIPNFDPNADYIKTAKVIPVSEPTEMNIATIIDSDVTYKVSAYLQFVHQGKAYQLTAFDGGPDYYFVLLKDESAGLTTYGAGRFIDVKRPVQDDNYTTLDFNKAYNPPCAFTDYATCPLPPNENYLPFSILAGEKRIKSH